MSAPLPGRAWHERGALHVDTRGLPPPEPMVAILGRLDRTPPPARVIAFLDREPVHLFPELVERGWRWTVESLPDGAVRLNLRPGG